MGSIRVTDSRIQEEIDAASVAFHRQTADVLPYISGEDQAALNGDEGWQDLLSLIVLVYRLYGLPRERASFMAALMSLLRFSGHLHGRIEDGMQGLDRQVQNRLLVGDMLMARALDLLARDEAHTLIDYFAGLVIHVSEGMVHRLRQGEPDRASIAGTEAPWYEAAFYSAARLAGQDGEPLEAAGRLGYKLGMLAETLRQGIAPQPEDALTPADWAVLPEGPEKTTLLQYARTIETALALEEREEK